MKSYIFTRRHSSCNASTLQSTHDCFLYYIRRKHVLYSLCELQVGGPHQTEASTPRCIYSAIYILKKKTAKITTPASGNERETGPDPTHELGTAVDDTAAVTPSRKTCNSQCHRLSISRHFLLWHSGVLRRWQI